VVLSRSLIKLEASLDPIQISIERDLVEDAKLFFVVSDVRGYILRSHSITLKQATALLIKCSHSFEYMTAALFFERDGQLCLRTVPKALEVADKLTPVFPTFDDSEGTRNPLFTFAPQASKSRLRQNISVKRLA